jgi:DNA-binding transcriptional LysR family regulator
LRGGNLSLEDLAAFVAAAERGSLTAAARALGVPKSTVSRRVARLEEALGQPLVHRTARSFRLTEAGDALLRRSAPALADLRDALRQSQDAASGPSGDLRISVPIDLAGSRRFCSMIVSFGTAWPSIRLTVDATDRMVDLANEGFDAAVRLHTRPLDSRASVMARRLEPAQMGLFASTGYLARRGRPSTVAELVDHDLIRIDRAGAPWGLLDRVPSLDPRAVGRRGLSTTTLSFGAAAAVAGAGIAVLPSFVADALPDIERVLPEVALPPLSMSVVWPESRRQSSRLRAFLDTVIEAFG